jgi:hypothetical protein
MPHEPNLRLSVVDQVSTFSRRCLPPPPGLAISGLFSADTSAKSKQCEENRLLIFRIEKTKELWAIFRPSGALCAVYASRLPPGRNQFFSFSEAARSVSEAEISSWSVMRISVFAGILCVFYRNPRNYRQIEGRFVAAIW